MPNTIKPKRVQVSCSLPPDQAARLQREADARILAPSALIERALSLLFTSFDTTPTEPNGS